MPRQPVHPKYHIITLKGWGSACSSGCLRRGSGSSAFIFDPLLATGSLGISRLPWSLSRTFIGGPWLVPECLSFESSKPPILCHPTESKSCDRYPQSILVLKGIINITQLLEEQFSFNFLLDFSIKLQGSKLQKAF
ncbi:hypothetical protein M9H77_09317 [Catharanthus roseus]|uniref:Uncharacterized protein n=1 Tax=Catharanthus roseus TaxID=4058 RepID=A0ACC0C098_CATRO|nr:hypothetical protein M9H77_09317 [Catharanthus roseus]